MIQKAYKLISNKMELYNTWTHIGERRGSMAPLAPVAPMRQVKLTLKASIFETLERILICL